MRRRKSCSTLDTKISKKKKLEQDRIRGNLGVRTEDLGFLQDQRGERKGFMGAEDMEYQRKKESQLKRRMGLRSVGSTSSQSSEMSLPEFLSSPEADPEADVQIPRNIMRSPMGRVSTSMRWF